MGRSSDPDLVVGPETADDAGVYRIGERLALVETVDIVTPLVDDPFTFGRIAAANALSDVFAMGGRPVTALNLVFFPACTLGGEVLAEILAGGLDAMREAGVCLVGGHTVEDDELKYGLAVTGLIDPARVVRNATARPGDQLILTKPLGTGIISTAIKADMASAAAEAEAIRWMTTLNAAAAGLMVECGASACTDVTGFGLLGHASEMARGSGVTVEFTLDAVPLMGGVGELVADGLVPAGCYRNRDHYAPLVSPSTGDDARFLPLFDPQTSGGLLIALPPAATGCFHAAAAKRGIFAATVGQVLPAGEHPVVLV
ncbi:selenide, water dikinase [Geotalea uraniireducens]|uniref:Selenide, water dikinase n=1 Tax=Geotalea uraniireducens TaxID=351604 RepID=A0ABM8EH70_9BACT|nr:selenide, water dikinase [Geotalea uraniireducens]